MSRESLRDRLSSSFQTYLSLIPTLSSEQVLYKPDPEKWSILEILEHVAVSESKVLRHAKNVIIPAGIDPDFVEDPEMTARMLFGLSDNGTKMQAPPSVLPKGRYHNALDALQQIQQSRVLATELLDLYGAELKKYKLDNANLGPLSLYQWIEWIPAHSDRHLLQIKEKL